MSQTPSWQNLQRRQAARPQQAAAATRSDDETVAAVLSGGNGDQFLRILYAMTIDSRCRPGASEAELREAEAKRHLVHQIEQMRDRGLQSMKERAQS